MKAVESVCCLCFGVGLIWKVRGYISSLKVIRFFRLSIKLVGVLGLIVDAYALFLIISRI